VAGPELAVVDVEEPALAVDDVVAPGLAVVDGVEPGLAVEGGLDLPDFTVVVVEFEDWPAVDDFGLVVVLVDADALAVEVLVEAFSRVVAVVAPGSIVAVVVGLAPLGGGIVHVRRREPS
jgi:hypothetical protein